MLENKIINSWKEEMPVLPQNPVGSIEDYGSKLDLLLSYSEDEPPDCSTWLTCIITGCPMTASINTLQKN